MAANRSNDPNAAEDHGGDMTETLPPPTLNIATRAARAAKRQNNKIRQRYPLLAEQLSVTVESQVTRLERQEQINADIFERWKQKEIKAWQRGMMLRDIARQELPEDDFECYEYRAMRIFGFRRYQDCGAYLSDWWWCAMREQGVAWLWDRCPNNHLHDSDYHREKGYCPTCGKPLEAPAKEPEMLQPALLQ